MNRGEYSTPIYHYAYAPGTQPGAKYLTSADAQDTAKRMRQLGYTINSVVRVKSKFIEDRSKL